MTENITIRAIVDANRKALAERRLGAFAHKSCQYKYDDGKRCAIGVVFSEAFAARLVQENDNFLAINEVRLAYRGEVLLEHIPIVRMTQRLHDSWAVQDAMRDDGNDFPAGPIQDFVRKHSDTIITESVFRAWIDLLDTTYPAGAAQ